MAFVYWLHLPEHENMLTEGYIGFTSKTVESRYKEHLQELKRNKKSKFYNALNKYKDQIVVKTLIEGSDEYCLLIENRLRPNPNIGWNTACGGEVGSLGITPSIETRALMSKSHKGENNSFYGKTHTPEARLKIAESRRGKSVPDEQKERLRQLCLSRNTAQHLPVMPKWTHPRATEIWTKALDILEYSIKFPANGLRKMAKAFKCTNGQISTLYNSIKSGWNPSEDAAYLAWLSEYKQKQELANGT